MGSYAMTTSVSKHILSLSLPVLSLTILTLVSATAVSLAQSTQAQTPTPQLSPNESARSLSDTLSDMSAAALSIHHAEDDLRQLMMVQQAIHSEMDAIRAENAKLKAASHGSSAPTSSTFPAPAPAQSHQVK